MNKKPNIVWRIIDSLDGIITGVIVGVIFIDVLLQIYSRLSPGHAYPWTNELGEILLCALIWIGLSAAVKSNGHIGFDLFVSKLSPRGKKWMGVINMGLFILYLLILAYLTREMIQPYLRRNTATPILRLNYYWVRLPMIIGSVCACIRLLIKEYRVVTNREKMYETSLLTE